MVDFADPNTEYITDVTPNVSGTNMVNVSPWCTTNDFNIAPIGTTWKFKLHVNKGTQPIVTMSIIMGGLVDTIYDCKYGKSENIFGLFTRLSC